MSSSRANTQSPPPILATLLTRSPRASSHAQRLADLATIKPHERQALYLKGLGYRYREIMQITGASYTAVNRRITEGRRSLRKLERDRENTSHVRRPTATPRRTAARGHGAPTGS